MTEKNVSVPKYCHRVSIKFCKFVLILKGIVFNANNGHMLKVKLKFTSATI